LRFGLGLTAILVVPLVLSTLVFPPHNGRISYTRLELFVVLVLLTAVVTATVGGVRSAVQLVFGWLRSTRASPTTARLWAWGWVAIGGLCGCAAIYGRYGEPYWIEVTTHELPLAGVRERVRLVVLTDIHSDRRFDLDRRIAATATAADADVVVFLGDALNDHKRLEPFREGLTAVRAKVAKLAIRGNWDVWYWSRLDLFAGTGFRELEADSVTLEVDGTPLRIVGHTWEDAWTPETVAGPQPPFDGVTVMLYHSHDYAEVAATRGVDLYLCGDTHGGQIALPGWGPLFAIGRFGSRYARGWYDVGGMRLFVSRGLGVERGVPLRFSARPEIAVIDLVPLTRD